MTGTIANADDPRPAAPHEPVGGPYAWYVLGVLMVAFMVSFIDRQLLTLLVGPIRATLGISDFQLSLLHGFAFALLYTVMGIPLGRLVDRRRRTVVIAGGIAVWSVMTALCGTARTFGQLFLTRVGVGIGEAALSPGAFSLLSDLFPPRELPRALSFYNSAAHVGAGIATMAGAALIALMPPVTLPVAGRLEPWQAVFLVVGIPGLIVALWVLSLREPRRTGLIRTAGADPEQPDLREVLRHLGSNRRAYGLLIGGYAIFGMIWTGSVAWFPTFFMRIHGWTIAETGLRYGIVVIVGGVGGSILGGTWSVRMRTRGLPDANIRIGLIALGISIPAGVAGMLAPTGILALACLTVFLAACAMPWGSAASALQDITPNQMRGQMSAIYLFCLNLTGLGMGPAIIAACTDHVFGNDNALPYAVVTAMLIGAPFAAALLWMSRAPYCAALARKAF